MAVHPQLQHFIAGGIAGGIGTIVTCPLEVAKTRLQAVNNKEIFKGNRRFGTGVFHLVYDIAKAEGVLGLWRGLGPALVGVLPSRATWFMTYYTSKSFIENKFEVSNSSVNFVSAIIAGFSVATITSPIWLVKTRMQLQSEVQDHSLRYKNSLDCVRKVYKAEGVKGFYRGLTASYVGISESSLQMVLYEKFREIVQKRKYTSQTPASKNYKDVKLDALEQFGVGSVAKLLAASLTYPHEVIRTRMREQRLPGQALKYTGFFQGLRVVAKEEGLAGLYAGMTPHLVRVVPNAAIMFFVYEAVMSFFKEGI